MTTEDLRGPDACPSVGDIRETHLIPVGVKMPVDLVAWNLHLLAVSEGVREHRAWETGLYAFKVPGACLFTTLEGLNGNSPPPKKIVVFKGACNPKDSSR